MSQKGEHAFKVVVVGASGVGKTSLVEKLLTGGFHEETQPTIGVQFKSYPLQSDGEAIKLQIWDTAGQERFRAVSKAYFRNAVGGILVFDLTNRQSFDDLNTWINDLTTLCAPKAHVVLVGNKVDLVHAREIVESEAQAFAQRYDLVYIETSAKSGSNVTEAFVRLGREILRKVSSGDITMSKPAAPTNLTTGQQPVEEPSTCC
jgi:small GTP-binding protein